MKAIHFGPDVAHLAAIDDLRRRERLLARAAARLAQLFSNETPLMANGYWSDRAPGAEARRDLIRQELCYTDRESWRLTRRREALEPQRSLF